MEENQDLTISADGLMNEGTEKFNNPDESAVISETNTNKLTPPPEQLPPDQTPAPKEKSKVESQEVILKSPPSDEGALDQEDTDVQVISEPPFDNTQKTIDESKQQSQEVVIRTPDEIAKINEKAAADQQSKVKKTGENRNNKKLAAMVTVLIAVMLTAVAMYVYVSTQNNAEELNNTNAESGI
jgi:hypothetical protein